MRALFTPWLWTAAIAALLWPVPDVAAQPVFPGKTWAARTPAEAGLDPESLQAFRQYVGGRGCVIRHGFLVYSWGDVARRADVASAFKPVLAHLLFWALQIGRLPSLDDPVSKFEPGLA